MFGLLCEIFKHDLLFDWILFMIRTEYRSVMNYNGLLWKKRPYHTSLARRQSARDGLTSSAILAQEMAQSLQLHPFCHIIQLWRFDFWCQRDTDELSYRKIGIPKGKIFIIKPKGEVAIDNCVDSRSYCSLHTLVNDMFPPTSPEQPAGRRSETRKKRGRRSETRKKRGRRSETRKKRGESQNSQHGSSGFDVG
ncbi:uncharacterized protein LOC116261273 isoform X1 [Nymphaea colorata]|nr:uncharacterized protein LOC116261273 isoform X1 [Nymphaea colorata]XP_049935395.1 uncharacterized protein LOC116261273 isoform X1 [Nymphaea colorata]XP_049935396.1 uncharacterized protein LOC116261273 isoform X1 [Nymphaea colorata]